MKIFEKINRVLGKVAFSKRNVPEIPAHYFESLSEKQVDDRSVYWVGHSLMQEVAKTPEGDISLFILMERFCKAKDVAYRAFDHTLYGAPLSMQWRGAPHSFTRLAPEMDHKRQDFPNAAKAFDTFVLTEVVPVKEVMNLEYSAWYLQQYAQTIRRQSPSARIYLYESWDYLHGGRSPLPPEQFNWQSAMVEQRQLWERMADMAAQSLAFAPTLQSHLSVIFGSEPKAYKEAPIFIVPVGTALIRLRERLSKPLPEDDFRLADGGELAFYQLFSNAYRDWPTEWPLENASEDRDSINERIQGLTLHDPNRERDDIHPSDIGIYLVALVHFATLYRRSPEGLPSLPGISEGLAQTLQRIAWQVVCEDVRSGVAH